MNKKAKNHAKRLIRDFYTWGINKEGQSLSMYECRELTLKVVDEILENFGQLTEGKEHYAAYCTIQFYQEVKKEIEKQGGDK